MIRMNPILGMLTILSACNQAPESKDPPPASVQNAPATPTPDNQAATASWSEASLEPSLAAYEKLRASLAADRTEGLGKVASTLAAAAARARAGAPAKTTASLGEIEKTARALASSAGEGIDQARTRFGTLSRHIIALLATHPKLRAGRHVFECPMASGYGKWVQTSEKLENPYMGKKMLQCGGKTEWSS